MRIVTTIVCANCKIHFKRSKHHKRTKTDTYFCSRKCKDLAQRIEGVKAIHPAHYRNGKHTYREKALKHYGTKCMVCGYQKFKSMLDGHHIDGNRSNNAVSNLIVLCVWCHACITRKVPFHRIGGLPRIRTELVSALQVRRPLLAVPKPI